MNIWMILGLIALLALEIYVLVSSSNRKQRLKDPNSPESQAISKLVGALSADTKESLLAEAAAGQTLSAVKRLRSLIPGTGLQEAQDAIELLKVRDGHS